MATEKWIIIINFRSADLNAAPAFTIVHYRPTLKWSEYTEVVWDYNKIHQHPLASNSDRFFTRTGEYFVAHASNCSTSSSPAYGASFHGRHIACKTSTWSRRKLLHILQSIFFQMRFSYTCVSLYISRPPASRFISAYCSIMLDQLVSTEVGVGDN